MNERLDHARQLGRRIDAAWLREDVEAQLAHLHARQRTRARRRAFAVPLAGVVITAAAFVAVSRAPNTAPPAAPALRGGARDVAIDRPLHEAGTRPTVMPAPAPAPARALAADGPAAPSSVRSPGDGSAVTPLAVRTDVARADRDAPAPPSEPPSAWRDDAGRGDYAAAWRAFARDDAPLDTMVDLLLAGDVARLSGHPEAAVAQLSRAVALHPEDPRAPLAAFTLGRVHLEDLGAPRDAAQAFARARELAPGGPLAEDALAREVEAWSRAGETETARAWALTYMRRYPQGHRAHAVRRFGGLESP